MVGMMRGQELCEEYAVPAPGRAMQKAGEHAVQPGQVDKVSPSIGDIHVVSNGLKDRASISIHVYGANIGAVARHTFDGNDGHSKPFVSGYSNSVIPNLWDRSADVRARLS
jgi:predicted metal-dependent enzyme (double-stranded beta helix superfamily)